MYRLVFEIKDELKKSEVLIMNQLEIAEQKGLKDVLVFQICECDSVAGYTLEEAKTWYKELTGLSDDELYSDEEIEIVPFEKEVWDGEERTGKITIREIVDTYWQGEPFIVASDMY
jgi:hypothetical protein